MLPWLRILVLAGLIILLVGCGVRTAYNNVDWLALRWLNDQIDLSDEQERLARRAIERKLAWHCANELPDYIDLIEQIDRDVASGSINANTLDGYGQTISAFGRRLLDQAQPGLIELMASLDDAQVERIINDIESRNAELGTEQDQTTPEQRRKDRVDDLARNLRRLLGRLNAEQNNRLEQWALDRQPTRAFERQRRESRDQRFIEAMAVRNDTIEFEQRMNALFQPESTHANAAPTLAQQATAHNRDNLLIALADVYALADDRQIRKLRKRLEDLAEDFQAVSCQTQA
ncbi:MAG: DUF6279 family lipoprotein [Pseudomonadota bacterium]